MDSNKKEINLIFQEFVKAFQQPNSTHNPQDVFWHILLWTGGQPGLTQNICQYMVQNSASVTADEEGSLVEKVITDYFCQKTEVDPNNSRIGERIYRKKFTNIINRHNGYTPYEQRLELVKIRQKLGLSFQQVEEIEKSVLQVFDQNKETIDLRLPIYENSNIEKLVVNENPVKTTPALLLNNQTTNQNQHNDDSHKKSLHQNLEEKVAKIQQKYRRKKLLRSWKHGGLILSFPLLILISFWISKWRVQSSSASNSSNQDYTFCKDVNTTQSDRRMSLGDKLLINQSSTTLNNGVKAFADCDWEQAIANFQEFLNTDKNNPEAVIYLNNAQAAEYPSLKIAVSVPIGTKLAVAQEMLRGVAQAQTEINREGGIEGKLLQVQIANDDNKPEIAQEIAFKLVQDKKILAVVGHNSTNTSLAGAFVYQQGGLAMISPTSTAMNPAEIGNYIFRVPPSIEALASTLGEYAVKSLGKTDIAVCSNSKSVASQSFVREFTVAVYRNQGQIIPIACDFSAENFDPNQIDFQQLAQQVDALLLAPSVEYIPEAIAVAQTNDTQLPLLGDHSMYIFETIEQGQGKTNNMVLPVPWQSGTVADSSFPDSAEKMWGGNVNWRTAMAYDATNAIIQGLKQSETRLGLRSALSDRRFSVNGATGQFKFDRGGRIGEVLLVQIKQAKTTDGDNYQFVPIQHN